MFSFILICIIVIYSVYKYSFKPSLRHPEIPAYRGLPLIGYLINFRDGHYEKRLSSLQQSLGTMCRVRLGSYECIWLNDYRLIREAWSNPIFCGRPKLPGITMRTHGFTGGIIFNEGEDFVEQRRFTVKHLKDFGLGKIAMEDAINQECSKIVSVINGQGEGTLISTRNLFNIASLNVLWTIVTGENYAHNDNDLQTITETLTRNMELKNGAMLAIFMPWLAKWFPKLVGWKNYLQDSNDIFEFWRSYASRRIKSFQDHQIQNHTNFVDLYINTIMQCNDPASSFYKEKGELSLASTLQDLAIAGSDTSGTTLAWIFLYLAVYENYQEMIFKEIETIIGSNEPRVMDRRKMPMTEAFILETMRFTTLAPLGMIHSTTETTTLRGFVIPEGSLVHANLCAAHRDPEAWETPNRFWPERFLSLDKEKVTRQDAFLAFSYGKRGCPGEALARNELFLFVVGILKYFQICTDPSTPNVDLYPNIGVSASPQSHKLLFKSRI